MKTRYLKVISAILALLMMASVMVIPSFAADELSGYELIQSYGFKYAGTKRDPNVDFESAAIVRDGDDSILRIKCPKNDNDKYPALLLDSSIVPTNMTNYTCSMDLIVQETAVNKLNYMIFAKDSANKYVGIGHRSGAVTANKDYSTPYVSGNVQIKTKYFYGQEGLLQDVNEVTNGKRVNYEVTVNGNDLTLKVNGITVPDFTYKSGYSLKESVVGMAAWHTNIYGYDNIKVTNNANGEVLYAEDFEPAAEQTITATAPAKDGKVFAGWYADAAFTTPVAAGATKGYAKFVVKNTLGLNVQISANTVAESVRTDLRLITTVDGTDYQKAGFMLKYEGKSAEKASTTVYSSITAMGADYKPTAVSHVAKYFSTFTLTNVPNAAFGKPIEVTPFWVTADGTVVTGNTVSVVINDLIA